VRVGVATGEVIAPAGHGTSPREIAGEALDAASRLREAAEPGTVLAAERTCRAAGARFRYGEPVRLPGLEPGARRVAGLVDDPAAAASGLRGPMIGRDAELGLMRNLFDEVVESELPRLLTVHGPAGIGKSRMTGEAVAAMVARHPGTLVLRGRCPSAGRGVTYSALGEMLREFCGISLADPAAATQARLRAGLRAILGAGEPADRAELDATVFALAVTAGIGLPGSPLDRVEPKAVADELARAWPRFATACAAAGPALFVVEDLHWADDRLLEMLELLVARSAGPLLVVATSRPELAETRPGFGAGLEGAASISLRPLPERHSQRLLDSLTPTGRLPDKLRREVLARAEGNPLFLEELVLHLEGEAAGALPDTLQSLLAARIDTLSVPEKQVLQQAAVVGRVFWEEPVERALGGTPVAAELHELERRGRARSSPGPSRPTASGCGRPRSRTCSGPARWHGGSRWPRPSSCTSRHGRWPAASGSGCSRSRSWATTTSRPTTASRPSPGGYRRSPSPGADPPTGPRTPPDPPGPVPSGDPPGVPRTPPAFGVPRTPPDPPGPVPSGDLPGVPRTPPAFGVPRTPPATARGCAARWPG